MNAAGIIQALITLGVTVKGAAANNITNGNIDWAKTVGSVLGDKSTAASVQQIFQDLQGSDIDAAIGEVQAKQKALLNGRPLPQLSNAEMLQYDDLVDAQLALATSDLKNAISSGLTAGVAGFIVNSLLPYLTSIASIVIPLLL